MKSQQACKYLATYTRSCQLPGSRYAHNCCPFPWPSHFGCRGFDAFSMAAGPQDVCRLYCVLQKKTAVACGVCHGHKKVRCDICSGE
jgi:hypothetical protein